MKRFFNSKGKIAVAAVGGIAVLSGGIGAFAYFTSSGSGTGSASVGSSNAFTVTQTSTTGTIYPGSGSSTIAYDVTNPSGGGDQNVALIVSSIKLFSGGPDAATAAGADIPGCLGSWFSTDDTGRAAYGSLASGSTVSGNVVVRMPANATTNQDACQGKSPGVNIAVS